MGPANRKKSSRIEEKNKGKQKVKRVRDLTEPSGGVGPRGPHFRNPQQESTEEAEDAWNNVAQGMSKNGRRNSENHSSADKSLENRSQP